MTYHFVQPFRSWIREEDHIVAQEHTQLPSALVLVYLPFLYQLSGSHITCAFRKIQSSEKMRGKSTISQLSLEGR